MIDKSLRQHYQEGEKVKKFGYDVGQKLNTTFQQDLKDEQEAQNFFIA